MANFKRDILKAAGNEPIIAIVVGDYAWGGYGDQSTVPDEKRGVVLTWDEAAPMLDYEYDAGFGAPECNAVYAWTADRVIAVSQYVGATWLYSIPRNPTSEMPKMAGGG